MENPDLESQFSYWNTEISERDALPHLPLIKTGGSIGLFPPNIVIPAKAVYNASGIILLSVVPVILIFLHKFLHFI
jgi:hypothetical protein